MNIQNKTVIVTGAGSGIGRALALEFASNGARVVCCGRNKQNLDETVRLTGKGSSFAIPTDITERSQVQQLVERCLKQYGGVDILFNNAGSFGSIAGVHEADPDAWWQDVKVNLLGSMLLIREVLPRMIQRNEGIIINMDGGRPVGGTGYAAGKAGLMELTRIMTHELKMLKSSVMVFGAGPGLVRTPMTEYQAMSAAGQRWIPSTKESFDSGNLRKPEDIARATIKLVQLARPEWSGKTYWPDTDFSKF